jgi:hypothetical protein
LRLANKPPGAFLVRLSSAAKSFTISKVSEESQIIHQRVLRHGNNYVIVDNNQAMGYHSLKELVDGVRDILKLSKAVSDNRIFAPFFEAKGLTKSEEYVNFISNSKLSSIIEVTPSTTALSSLPSASSLSGSPSASLSNSRDKKDKKDKKAKKGSKNRKDKEKKDKKDKKKGKEGKKK